MDNDDTSNSRRCSHGPVQNMNDEATTFVYETQPFIVQEQHAEKRKRKCHGNRKLQHFKRKCRALGLTEEQITGLIQTKRHAISEQSPNDQSKAIVAQDKQQSKKRKRDVSQQNLMSSSMKSLSQLSLSQQKSTTKRKKSNQDESRVDINTITIYKSSKYLRMPRRLLLRSLRLQLNHPIKEENEQQFILARLRLLDELFCIDQIQCLYQYYFEQGLKFRMWPVSLHDVRYLSLDNITVSYFVSHRKLF